MQGRSIAGSILAIIGGALILVQGLIIAYISLTSFNQVLTMLSGSAPPEAIEYWRVAGPLLLIALSIVFGCIFGALVISSGVLALRGRRILPGVMAIVFSILSIFSGGGFLIGLILGVIGGILILVLR